MDSLEDSPPGARWSVLVYLLLFAVSMAYFEAAVVVYLRELFYPEGFAFPLRIIGRGDIIVEIGRELSTIVMLVVVARLAGRFFYERLALFLIIFGVWDIFFYGWLKFILGWPAGLLTWDILFLVPLPWIGPVLSPVVVSLCMIVGAGLVLKRVWSGGVFAPNFREWAIAVGGAFLILLSYVVDLDAGRGFALPGPYRWDMLIVGLAAGFYAVIRSLTRTRKKECTQ
ncbi:MAG TPA: hypothetical protein VM123_04540 [archaeon]|nr:hypothetical protein [archaeon]